MKDTTASAIIVSYFSFAFSTHLDVLKVTEKHSVKNINAKITKEKIKTKIAVLIIILCIRLSSSSVNFLSDSLLYAFASYVSRSIKFGEPRFPLSA